MTDYIVNIRDEELTESHIEVYDQLMKTVWSFTEPAYFGEDLHSAIKFKGFELRKVSDLKIGSQRNRAGGRSEDYKDVQTSIYTKGYKLKYLPPAVLESPLLDFGRETMTGDTRIEVFDTFNQEYIIVAVFEPVEGVKSKYVLHEAINRMGQKLNDRDPQSDSNVADIKRAVERQCELFKQSSGKAGVNPSILAEILDEVSKMNTGLTETKRNDIGYEIYSNYSDGSDVIVSWTASPNALYNVENYMTKFKFVKNEKVIYFHSALSTISKAFTKSCRLAMEYPKHEIRIVFHTSTLKGNDLQSSYHGLATKYINLFEDMKTNAAFALTGSSVVNPDRIKIHGLMPALSSIHDLTKPVLYNKDNRTLYQRGTDYRYVIETDEDDFDFADVA
jgi:hypothetical protein